MKNKFLPHKLLQYCLLFSNSVCFHPISLYAVESSKSEAETRFSDWHKGEPSASANLNADLGKLQDRSLKRSYASAKKTQISTPGQLLFPIDSSQSPAQRTINGSMSSKPAQSTTAKQLIAQNEGPIAATSGAMQPIDRNIELPVINFNNISIIEYIRFISRITNKNFVFDENDLQFNVTIISEEPTSFENIMTALLQELRIHGLTMLEQGNNLIIHRNSKVNAISQVVTDDPSRFRQNSEIVTQVFKLNTLKPADIASVIKPLTSEFALVDVLEGSNHLIITDLTSNIKQIAKLIKSVDAPASGLVIGQYVVRSTPPEMLIQMTQHMIAPISQDQPLTMVAWEPSSSIFIVSTPFLVERTLSILQHLDQNEKSTRVFDLNDFRFNARRGAKGTKPSGLYINDQPFDTTGQAGQKPSPGIPVIPVIPEFPEFPDFGGAIPEDELITPGKWYREGNGKMTFPLGKQAGDSRSTPPEGQWKLDKDGNWYFEASKGPRKPGKWKQDQNGRWIFEPSGEPAGEGSWKQDENGRWYFEAGSSPLEGGKWIQDANGKWHFDPNPLPSRFGTWKQGNEGKWYLEGYPGITIPDDLKEESLPQPAGVWFYDPINGWTYELDKGEGIGIKRLTRQGPENAPTPFGAKQKAQFYVYKVKYRRGDTIQSSLNAIADSLSISGDNEELLATLTSVQWIETTNSLIFTGLQEDLLKMRELMEQVDVPLRQVFIEMLILETSMDDSLEYGVTWGSRFGGGNWAGGQSFSTDLSPINSALSQTGNPGGLGSAVDNTLLNTANTTSTGSGATLGTSLAASIIPVRAGLDMGVIGQSIINTSLGVQFNSIGALLHALRTKINTNVILSPKIITEDNVPAEIFVGENISFKTQSLANDQNNTITNNFEYRDVGTRLRVTPTIGSNDIISLEIANEISRIIPSTIPTSSQNGNNAPGPSTTKSTTTTRVHLPNGYFLIISGMMNDETDRYTTQVPCLGGVPVVGGLFKDKRYDDRKRNQMIFLRPRIIDTEEELQNLTKHEQDIWDYKHRRKKDWIYETEEAYDYLNLKRDIVEADPEIADRDY